MQKPWQDCRETVDALGLESTWSTLQRGNDLNNSVWWLQRGIIKPSISFCGIQAITLVLMDRNVFEAFTNISHNPPVSHLTTKPPQNEKMMTRQEVKPSISKSNLQTSGGTAFFAWVREEARTYHIIYVSWRWNGLPTSTGCHYRLLSQMGKY